MLFSADSPYIVSKHDLKLAFDALPLSEQDLLRRTADRIRKFATAQVQALSDHKLVSNNLYTLLYVKLERFYKRDRGTNTRRVGWPLHSACRECWMLCTGGAIPATFICSNDRDHSQGCRGETCMGCIS